MDDEAGHPFLKGGPGARPPFYLLAKAAGAVQVIEEGGLLVINGSELRGDLGIQGWCQQCLLGLPW